MRTGSICLAALAGVAFSVSAGATQAQEILVAGFNSDRLHRYSLAGTHLGDVGVGVLDGAICARLGPDGLLYVASEGSNTVERFDPSTYAHLGTFVAAGAGGLAGPTSLTWDAQGRLYVGSFNNDRVLRYTTAGLFDTTFIPANRGGLNGPDNGMIFGPDGHLYVPSFFSNRVLKYDGVTGAFIGAIGGTINRPRVLIFRGDDLLVTSETANAVLRIDWRNNVVRTPFVAAGAGGLAVPVGMALAPDGRLMVSTLNLDSVLAYNGQSGAPQGTFVPGGRGGLDGPLFITVVPTPSTGGVLVIGAAWGCRRRRAGH